jgi:hypothetical protein
MTKKVCEQTCKNCQHHISGSYSLNVGSKMKPFGFCNKESVLDDGRKDCDLWEKRKRKSLR